MDTLDQEVLFVGTAEAEHVEMYLKAIWHIKEREEAVKISTIAKNAKRQTTKCSPDVKKTQ